MAEFMEMRNAKGGTPLPSHPSSEPKGKREIIYGMRRTAYLSSTTTEAFYAELGFAYFALEMEKNAWR